MGRPRALLAGGVAVALLTVGCSALEGDESIRTEDGSAIAQFSPTEREVIELPASAPGIDGEQLDLPALTRGKVVVLNVWASWCGPCVKEAPALRRADARFDSSEVAFLGINIRDNEASAKAFARTHRLRYPNVSDPSSALLGELSSKLTVGMPLTAVIGADGRMSALVKGAVSTATVAALVDEALAEK
ncbi:TlpA disulfide reductase family protein [Nocardioides dubius]|uniref:TlpA disulfide reductase family protein n=1 Tax=Nocardioides dubius TaxID=317019 RepID=A0ABN1U5R1_9ACTN